MAAVVVPVMVGVASLVILSVELRPVSLAVVRAGTDGAAGAVTSTTIDVALEATLTFPARSVVFAVIDRAPSGRVLEAIR